MLYFLFAPTPFTGTRSVTKKLRNGILAVAEAVWRWHRRRVTIRELQALDSRTLKDIGLDRSEIASAVYTGRQMRSAFAELDIYRTGR